MDRLPGESRGVGLYLYEASRVTRYQDLPLFGIIRDTLESFSSERVFRFSALASFKRDFFAGTENPSFASKFFDVKFSDVKFFSVKESESETARIIRVSG
jgi:hypothetical protein